MTAKEEITRIIEGQPDDSSFDELLRELAFSRTIQRGLEDSVAGRTIPDEEVRLRIEEWRK
jgi:predicted transcriptional regulator